MPKILVLGAGFVAEPLVEYLSRANDNQITVASYLLAEAENLADKFKQVRPLQADVSDFAAMANLIKDYALVISLVPAPFHPRIAKACIQCGVSMVTASYESDEMRELAEEAKAAGICILNEIGLDPGIDHLSAMQIIDEVHAKGEEVDTFVSWCGGLPAPACNDNPLGYKFSWAPKGVLMALLNEAVYLRDNQTVTVASDQLMSWTKPLQVDELELEGYPNRESVSYKQVYGIKEATTILRGTLRYQGFSEIIKAAKQLKLLSTDSFDVSAVNHWQDFVLALNGVASLEQLSKNLSPVAKQGLEWLGCFSELSIAKQATPIDIFCELLKDKLKYQEGETDMVVLQHKFVIRGADSSEYFISSTLKTLGDSEGYSAMSKTVGYPAAIASQLLLDGKISQKGLLLPVNKEIYEPVLSALKAEQLICKEATFDNSQISKQQFLSELVS